MAQTVDIRGARLLVIAPHPDDEVIGCGGLIKRVKDEGGKVFVQFVTVGNTVDRGHGGLSTICERQKEAADATAFLGVDAYDLGLVGNEYHLHLDQVPQFELIGMLDCKSPLALSKVKPSIVLLPDVESYNQDHRAVARAALTALRPAAGVMRHAPDVVLTYEQVADHWKPGPAPAPNVFVRLSESQLAAKLSALGLYMSQHRAMPDPRSVESLRSLAQFRGAQSGLGLAEAFTCLRYCM